MPVKFTLWAIVLNEHAFIRVALLVRFAPRELWLGQYHRTIWYMFERGLRQGNALPLGRKVAASI